MARIALGVFATAVLLSAPLAPASADDTGVAQVLHDLKREGKRTCMVTHSHSGSSAGEASRKAAEIAAVKAWAGFTAWEYGTDWAQWTKAAGKQMSCTQSGASWGCSVDARPCR